MDNKTKQCQNCQREFIIKPEDFEFYEKMKVPSPTWCPECRMIRKLAFRNDRILYKRKCDLCGDMVFSRISSEQICLMYCQKCWWSDKWNPIDYGKDYNFSEPFFVQFYKLFNSIPFPNLNNRNTVNCSYCEAIKDSKNCYKMTGGSRAEDCMYSECYLADNIVDSELLFKGNQAYETIDCTNVSKVFYSNYLEDCVDVFFSSDCRGCSCCFGCINLRNKSYCIFNKQFSEEEYKKEISKWNFGSYKVVQGVKKKFQEIYFNTPRQFTRNKNCLNVIGDNLQQTKNCYSCFGSRSGVENCKYIFFWEVYHLKTVMMFLLAVINQN